MTTLLPKCRSLSHAKQHHSHLVTTGHFRFKISPSRSKLLQLYALSLNNLSVAIKTFYQIVTPSTADWNAILRALIQSTHPIDSFRWYRNMIRGLYKVDALTCTFVLKACARALACSESTQLHSHTVRKGFAADALLGTTLLDLYAKIGNLDSAQKVFDEMLVKVTASWTALIFGFAQGNKPSEALGLFKRMEVLGLKPDETTLLAALCACSQLGASKEGEKIHEFIKNQKLDLNVRVCNALIDMYAKCGSADKAYLVFESLGPNKTLVNWNTMVMAFAMHGDGVKALGLFKHMGQEGLIPDAKSYLAVLCACNYSGSVEEGYRLFNSMESSGVIPSIKHYGSVVDLLGQAGRVREAYDVINSMPMVPDLVIWQTLLRACRTCGNAEIAELVSRKLVEMGSDHAFPVKERWTSVDWLRETMTNRDVEKVVGVSYIEEKGVIRKFYDGDKSHKSWRKIYAKLREIRFKIKEYGYLTDIGEKIETMNVLWHHSEKLAVAFGMISTGERMPIQVIKNPRICGDCHVVIKLISKIYNREIIVRDQVRFHRFKQGTCSCRDFW
ncbi:pentatricopeptide repeat-containing protein At1g34160 [Ricinus communis]|uniref:pentatricopeptide repeat-containing protein At1g34160 n=1 Tax=Ricinus communis TaxID=3988 RepID=UPI000772C809|nr:pentatricopeptide repeat-containing protein At1g34160 [Ricinus communis]|eukprot:XP_015579626.1 pentatricopeptide repeat-containing protein At1g34160 [Ricinus communis]